MKPSLLAALCACLLLAVSASPAPAAEKEPGDGPAVPEIVQKLRSRVYNLTDRGLRTLETEIRIPIPLLEGALFKLYFQVPDRQVLDVEGVDPEMKTMFLAMLKDMTVFTRYLFGLGDLIRYVCTCEIQISNETLEKIGRVTRIRACPRPQPDAEKKDGKEDEDEPSKPQGPGILTIWVDENLEPVKLAQEQGSSRMEAMVEVLEKEGKLLISSLTLRKGDGGVPIRILIKYKKTHKLWLPSEIQIPSQMNPDQPLRVTLQKYRINEKLPEGLLKKEDKKKNRPSEDDEGF